MASWGYDGSITEAQWADMLPDYYVDGAGDWKVTAKTDADRSVIVAAGSGGGYGVRDDGTSEVVLGPAAAVASGSRWDTVVMHRDWQPAGGTSAFTLLTGSSTKAVASARETNPGVVDDQPIALVKFTAGQTLPQEIVDLRVWRGEGGAVAADVTALSYLTRPGSRVRIGTTDWVRTVDTTTGTSAWVASPDNLGVGGVGSALVGSGAVVGTSAFQVQGATVSQATSSLGVATVTFPSAFANGVLTVVLTNGDDIVANDITLGLTATSKTGFSYRVWGPPGGTTNYTRSVLGTFTHRLNWLAIGW